MHPECFDGMNFETRLKASFAATPDKQVIVLRDKGIPMGYAFATIENIHAGDKSAFPDWAPVQGVKNCKGFYPDWPALPARCGCVNNLYLRPVYLGRGLGSHLLRLSMEWIRTFVDVEVVFVYISNGNYAALDFYSRHGFIFSHEVFGGFIKAMYHRFDHAT